MNRPCAALALALLATVAGSALGAEKLTPRSLASRIEAKPRGEKAKQLAQEVRDWFGKDNLATGAGPKVEGLDTSWAIEAPGAKSVAVVTHEGKTLPLSRIGDTSVYAATIPLADGTGFLWTYMVDGKPLKKGTLEVYTEPRELTPRPNTSKGRLVQQKPWTSQTYPDTTRDWWIYIPDQYRSDKRACVMVFQDGRGYLDFVPTVFDNLIAKKEMPVTVAILINPGQGKGEDGRGQRSVEYDTLSDRYARFLLEEILPEAEKTVKLRHDAESRAIAGISSGGICAWTVAWQRPEEFSKVLSWVGSFTDIASGKTLVEGGHNYPPLIRKTKPAKPIRVFLQDGANDLDNEHGNWPLANQEMAKALAFRDYDYKFVFGQGFHSNRHGRAILPDSLRWLWRDYRPGEEKKPGR